MLITEVIRRVDEVYPNTYTEDEKFRWCDEVSAEVTQEIKKVYTQVSCRVYENDFIELPQNVSIEQVKYLFIDGRMQDKEEFLKRFHVCPYGVCEQEGIPEAGIQVQLVFLPEHQPIRREVLRVSCDLVPDSWEDECEEPYEGEKFPKAYTGTFTFYGPDVSAGDNLEVVQTEAENPDWSTAKVYYVLGCDFEGTHVACDTEITEAKNKPYVMRRKLLDKTVVPPPYDKMYVEYVLAQITYFQHDYDEYNLHLSNYLSIFDAYAKWYKNSNPLDKCAKLRNFW